MGSTANQVARRACTCAIVQAGVLHQAFGAYFAAPAAGTELA